MENRELIDFMHLAERLKDDIRHCVTSQGRPESVAEHSWRVALMAVLLEDDMKDLDTHKILKMTVLHDLGEALTGDIPSFLKTEDDAKKEDDALYGVLDKMSSPTKEKLIALFDEMHALETKEAKVYKALDKMEAVIQHNESPLDTWLPLEYELNQTYGYQEAEEAHEKLFEIRKLLVEDTKQKLIDEQGSMKKA
ncbi:MAG: HD domain-containing protein [Bacillota bacterium]